MSCNVITVHSANNKLRNGLLTTTKLVSALVPIFLLIALFVLFVIVSFEILKFMNSGTICCTNKGDLFLPCYISILFGLIWLHPCVCMRRGHERHESKYCTNSILGERQCWMTLATGNPFNMKKKYLSSFST